jgi:hypothetical protein
MFTIQRTLNELNILIRMYWRRHATLFLINAAYIALVHYGIFKAESDASSVFIFPYQVLTVLPLYIMLMVICTDVFRQLRHPIGGIQYLMTPSSTLEKFVASWIYSFLLTLIAYILIYNLTHLLCVGFLNAFTNIHFSIGHVESVLPKIGMSATGIPFLFQNWSEANELLLVALSVQPYFLLGSAFFKKNSFIKTILAGIGFGILVGIGKYLLLQMFGVDTTIYSRSGQTITLAFSDDFSQGMMQVSMFLKYMLPFLAWYLTYAVLKRKQI